MQAYGPAILAGVITLAIVLTGMRLRRARAVLVAAYAVVGAASYLYWIHVEAGPPHGNYVPAFDSAGEIAEGAAIALAAIVAWPLWPILRTLLLDM